MYIGILINHFLVIIFYLQQLFTSPLLHCTTGIQYQMPGWIFGVLAAALFTSLGFEFRALNDNGAEALLAIPDTFPAEFAVSFPTPVIQKELPLLFFFLRHTRHPHHLHVWYSRYSLTDPLLKMYLPGAIFGRFLRCEALLSSETMKLP